MRFIKDIIALAQRKSKRTDKKLIAYLKTFLDVNLWIVFTYRISNLFYKFKLYPFSKLFWLLNRIIFTVDIDPRADFAGGLVIIHGMGIVVGHEVRSLGPIVIYQGATLGGNMGKRKIIFNINTGQPVLAANVIIGIDACVLGPIFIGKNSIIGTKAIVTKDVPENTIVIGSNKQLCRK